MVTQERFFDSKSCNPFFRQVIKFTRLSLLYLLNYLQLFVISTYKGHTYMYYNRVRITMKSNISGKALNTCTLLGCIFRPLINKTFESKLFVRGK